MFDVSSPILGWFFYHHLWCFNHIWSEKKLHVSNGFRGIFATVKRKLQPLPPWVFHPRSRLGHPKMSQFGRRELRHGAQPEVTGEALTERRKSAEIGDLCGVWLWCVVYFVYLLVYWFMLSIYFMCLVIYSFIYLFILMMRWWCIVYFVYLLVYWFILSTYFMRVVIYSLSFIIIHSLWCVDDAVV